MNTTTSAVRLAAALVLVLAAACGEPEEPIVPDDTACAPESGTICTIVGTGLAGFNGDGLDAIETDVYLPQDATIGPDGLLYFTDWNNHRIRVVSDDGAVETAAGTGLLGDGPEGPALEADFNHPTQVVFDPQGRMIIAAWHNSRLKRLDMATGLLEDIGGTGARAYAGDGGPLETAVLDLPASVVFDGDGNMLVMDQANQVIRQVDPSGVITRVAGQCVVNECAVGESATTCPGNNNKTGCGLEADPGLCSKPCIPAYAGDDGPADALRMAQPFGQAADPAGRMVMDGDGNLYFADTRNNRIRRIDTNGIVTTVAGNGEAGPAGDGVAATEAQLSSPTDVALGADGTLYIADTQNSCVRAVSPDGIIRTIAGTCGQRGFAGDGGDPAQALLDRPYGVELDGDDNLYVVDTHNHRIRLVLR